MAKVGIEKELLSLRVDFVGQADDEIGVGEGEALYGLVADELLEVNPAEVLFLADHLHYKLTIRDMV